MKFKTTIERSDLPAVEAVVTAHNAYEARIKALRRWTGDRRLCVFRPYNPLPDQDPSGQAGYGYATAPKSSGCDLSAVTSLVRVYMEPC